MLDLDLIHLASAIEDIPRSSALMAIVTILTLLTVPQTSQLALFVVSAWARKAAKLASILPSLVAIRAMALSMC